MLGLIPQALYDDEKRNRKTAEDAVRDCQRQLAAAQQLAADRNQVIDDYRKLYQQEVDSRRQDRAEHAAQMKTLLAHVAPLAPEREAEAGTPPRRATADDIMLEPATGKRGQIARKRAADARREQDQSEADREAAEHRKGLLTEEERRNMEDATFDATLGVSFDVAKSDNESHADN